MRTFQLQQELWVSRPIEEVFAFFSRPENLQALTPDWLDFRIVDAPATLGAGSLIRYRLRWHGLPIRWTTEISEWDPPHKFVDRVLSAPYKLWNHEHQFEARGSGTIIRDHVTYALPLSWLGVLAHRLRVQSDVKKIFDFRAEQLRKLFPA
jgi:ligand-binding SRPBCC domain-containing protein